MSVASEDTPLSRSLGGLDLGSRALLDLSLRRGVSDAEIARLLGLEPADVARRRTSALEHIGRDLGLARPGAHDGLEDDVREALAHRERGPAPSASAEAPAVPAPARPARPGVAAAVLAALVTVALLLVLLVVTERSGDRSAAPAPPPTTALEALGDGTSSAAGTGRIVGREGSARLELSLRGIPRRPGTIQVWLYDSQSAARPLARVARDASALRIRLPPGFARYRFVDVSIEPADGNDNHSGESVLRAPVNALRTGR